ncbi:DNA-protecting protein DprA [Sphingomonas antarctica]|uniref:DNA-processing protein DprA n=1 Tax=Sphingomonas antarctica TaxID=2040274 RepID=UPI0039E96DF0
MTLEQLAKLRLVRSERVGPITFRQLVARFGSATAALSALPDLARRGGGAPLRIASEAEVTTEARAVERAGARYLFAGDADFPPLLAELDNAPVAMTVRGHCEILTRPCIAIVGARNASAAACRFARELALGLADRDCVVVSGLARGIDTAAHQGSLRGGTIGVIASGIDIAFPRENADLQEAVATDGLLIAEQPPGTEPLARHFPYRNRIIAGLGVGTVVVEAAPKSGSLITARLANEAGREVMAVPGSPLDPRAQGCNLLIREGATLIQNADDVLEAISAMSGHVRSAREAYEAMPVAMDVDDAAFDAVCSLMSHTPVAIDELVRQSGLPSPVVAAALLDLELAGTVIRHAGSRVALR